MCPDDPENLDDLLKDYEADPGPWDYEPPRRVDGEMDAYAVVEELQKRADIGSILENNPRAQTYQIVHALDFGARNTYARGGRSLVAIILQQPAKPGTTAFLRSLRERIAADEREDAAAAFTAAVTFAVAHLLKRREHHWHDRPEMASVVQALQVQQATQIPVDDAMREAAAAALPVVVEKDPAQAQALVSAFGIPAASVRQAALGIVYKPATIAQLRAQQLAVPANDDPELRARALEIVQHMLRHGHDDPEKYRTAYDIPDEEYRDAVWKGLVWRVCMPRNCGTAVADFQQELQRYGIPLRTDDPAARARVLESMQLNIDREMGYVADLQNLFGLSRDELQPLRDRQGMACCRNILDHASPDVRKLRKAQEILQMTAEELAALLRSEHLTKLAKSWPYIDAWERHLQEAGLLTPEGIRSNWEQALHDGIAGNQSWGVLTGLSQKLGGGTVAVLAADTTATVASKRYLECLELGRLDDIEHLEQLCDLSLIRDTPAETAAAKRGMQHLLEINFVDIAGARRMMEKYRFTEADLHVAAGSAAITHLGAGWHAQLDKVRTEFPVEEALRSDDARKASGAIVRSAFASWLEMERSSRSYDRQQRGDQSGQVYIDEARAEIVLRSIDIGGYDPDAIEAAMREGKNPLLPAYEQEHLAAFLLCKRRCPGGFRQAFERDDVRAHAETTFIVPTLERGAEDAARGHIELTAFPKQRLREVGLEVFDRLFTEGKYTLALTAASICNIDDSAVATHIGNKMREDRAAIVPHLEGIPVPVLNRLEHEFSLRSYSDDIGLPSVAIYSRYKELADNRDVLGREAFSASIKKGLNTVTAGGAQEPSITALPYYADLMQAAFPNNAGEHWTCFERNEHCEDRSADLAPYKVRDQYSFTVAPGQDMALKNGRARDITGYNKMHEPLEHVHGVYDRLGFGAEKMLAHFDGELTTESAGLQPPEAFATREEKLCGLFLEHMRGSYPADKFKRLLISYQYAAYPDIRAYLNGTRNRAEKSRNPEYAYLLELHEFFADRLKDVARTVMETALRNPALRQQLPIYFQSCAAQESARSDGQQIASLRLDSLGIAPGFLTQLKRQLRQQTQREYSDEEVLRLIREYEDSMAEMGEGAIVDRGLLPAIWGQIRTQRTKTIRAIATLSGVNVHPSEIRLGDVNLQQLLDERRSMVSGGYNEDVFSAYMSRRFSEVFGGEVSFIKAEIGKYEAKDAESGAKPKRVEAFITKNHTSAHARGTAGVCTSGDNPVPNTTNGEAPPNQWQMPNYLQMVLRDSETKLCKGCILMHVEYDGDKKILTAAMNPSSTYLYQVNEEEMFRNLRDQLIIFAEDNDFDAVAVSQNKQIRTNRTGGLFERAMDKAIAETKQPHTLSTERMFSYRHFYQQRELDCIWVRKPAKTPTTPS